MHTVVVVEDDPAVRRVVRLMLIKGGYRALEAGPEDAAEIARSEPIDLLITDVIMPRFSCERVVAAVRRHRPEVKVLYMSGYHEDMLERCGVSQYAENFLRKPFSTEKLSSKVRRLLESSSVAEVPEAVLEAVAAFGPA